MKAKLAPAAKAEREGRSKVTLRRKMASLRVGLQRRQLKRRERR